VKKIIELSISQKYLSEKGLTTYYYYIILVIIDMSLCDLYHSKYKIMTTIVIVARIWCEDDKGRWNTNQA